MSWSSGSDIFEKVFEIVETYISLEHERVIYLSSFVNLLTEHDMDYESIMRFNPRIDSMLKKIETRWEIYDKYIEDVQDKLSAECNWEISHHYVVKMRRSVETAELKAIRKKSVDNLALFNEVLEASEIMSKDDEYFVTELIDCFHLPKKSIEEFITNDPKRYEDFQMVEKEKFQREEQINKKIRNLKTVETIESVLKKTESAMKRALTIQRKKDDESEVERQREIRSKSKTSAKTENAEGLEKRDTTNLDKKLEAKAEAEAKKQRQELVKAISDKTNLAEADVGNVLEALTQKLVEDIQERGGCDVLSIALLKAKRLEEAGVRKTINPFTGEPMMLSARPKQFRIKAKALHRLNALLEDEGSS